MFKFLRLVALRPLMYHLQMQDGDIPLVSIIPLTVMKQFKGGGNVVTYMELSMIAFLSSITYTFILYVRAYMCVQSVSHTVGLLVRTHDCLWIPQPSITALRELNVYKLCIGN